MSKRNTPLSVGMGPWFPAVRGAGSSGLNWRSSNIQGPYTVTRAGAANVFGSDGSIVAVAADRPRFDYDGHIGERLGVRIEEAETNCAASDGAGAVASASPILSGGSWPTGWHTTNSGAATYYLVEQVGNRTRVRFVGSVVTTILLQMALATAVPVNVGEQWSAGFRFRLVSGTMPSLATVGVVERTAGGAYVNAYGVTFVPQTDMTFQEEYNHTVIAGARLCPLFQFSGSTSYDFTVDIEAVQLVNKARLGSFIASASGTPATRNADDCDWTGTPTATMSMTIDADASRQSVTGSLLQSDAANDNNNRVEVALSGSLLQLNVVVGGVLTSANLGVWIPMMRGRVALSIGVASVSASFNGQDAVTVAAVPAGLTTLKLGRGATGYWNGTIGRPPIPISAVWDAATLKVNSVYGMFDNLTRANNASLGSATTGQTYTQYDPTVNANNQIVKMAISSNKATTAASGQTSTFSYSGVDMGASINAIGVAYSYATSSAGPVTLVCVPAGLGVVNDILTNSAHPNFTGPQSGGVSISRFASGVVVTTHNGVYESATAGGTTYYAAAKYGDNAVVVRGRDGRLQRCYDPSFSLTRSRYGLFEASRGNITDSLPSFSTVKMDLAAA